MYQKILKKLTIPISNLMEIYINMYPEVPKNGISQ